MATPKLMIITGNGKEPTGVCEACGAKFPTHEPSTVGRGNQVVRIYVDFAVHHCLEQEVLVPTRA